MTRTIVTTAVILGLASTPAFARDSTWLLCRGVATTHDGGKAYLVANLLEHRAADGEHRDLEVILIRGAVASRATVAGDKVGEVFGRSVPLRTVVDGKALFDGTAKVSVRAGAQELALDGKLDLNNGAGKPSLATITARLACEELDEMAIGH